MSENQGIKRSEKQENQKKRDRGTRESEEEDKEIARDNKKIIRSPEYHRRGETKEEDMEEIKKVMEKVVEELKKNSTELKNLREEMTRRDEKWEKENHQLKKRVEVLERTLERQEKDKRRNNIVINGYEIKGPNIEKEVEDFIGKELKVEATVKEAYKIKSEQGKFIVVAKLESLYKKTEVMKNKNKLKGRNIFIESDMTKEERKIQYEIRNIARGEIKKGNKTKVSYQKIYINDKVYKWAAEENGVVEVEQKERFSKN